MTPLFVHPATTDYYFGPKHPLKPERLRRTLRLLAACGGPTPQDPGLGSTADLLRVHDGDYVAAVSDLDPAGGPDLSHLGERRAEGIGHAPAGRGLRDPESRTLRYGLYGDTPVFARMFETSLAYVSATVRAAEEVRDRGGRAIAIGGGLHHAHRDRASGFCVFDDPAIAIHVLRERYARVAYVDIDVHHGDGPQWMFLDDPAVLTCSIHEEGRSLFPGTGWMEELGRHGTSVNVPLPAGTGSESWLTAFRSTILPALDRYRPQAVVLQMGTDPHFLDPLGHIEVTTQDWLAAVRAVADLNLPTVALGGGGYDLRTVPVMWTAACLTLSGIEVPERLPDDLAREWNVRRFFDLPSESPDPRERAREVRDLVLRFRREVLPFVPN